MAKLKDNIDDSDTIFHTIQTLIDFLKLQPKYLTLICFGLNKLMKIIRNINQLYNKNQNIIKKITIPEKSIEIFKEKIINAFLSENFNIIYVCINLLNLNTNTICFHSINLLKMYLKLCFSLNKVI